MRCLHNPIKTLPFAFKSALLPLSQRWPSSLPSIFKVSVSTMSNNLNGHVSLPSEPQRAYQVVVAATKEMGIGKDGKLPWTLPTDLKFFKELTLTTSDPSKKNAVVMGRKTWESIPTKYRPLSGRLNVVLTRSSGFDIANTENVVTCRRGGEVLRDSLNGPRCEAIHLTEIDTSVDCDTFVPEIDASAYQPWCSSLPVCENGLRFSFTTYVRVKSDESKEGLHVDWRKFSSLLPKKVFERHEEFLYLNMVNEIISNGNVKNDRTGTGTLSKFGCQMTFNLRRSFPLLTTKRVFWRGVVEELLWFISGSTNAKLLQEKGIHIWDGNASREYLDGIGLTEREEGDLGPVYGFQWRHFGAKYTDMHADYTGQGFDQLSDVINKIKNNPDDRRIIMSAWNPSDLKAMALPPCHMFAQFYVANGELSCQMYQRSADMGLGVPFNIASYSLLTCILAHVCDLVPGDFIHVIGDAHVYKNHVRPLQEQLENPPKPFPVLKINPEKKHIDSFVAADFELIGYDPHKKIDMKMAV
ncbi:bifunctional dihydrofolate reductase-thymidylate synthase 2-like isoform X3 [Brassica napus]|uniref:bifunctional dihydrofolate reductase-thymidylate synthase 2-like isoform X3 n=1 Tax=Brassica napus TaxID=3708 RepID=UPI002078ED09|nr:bifunctional dihydrofolate reductase-thymidylate synthase 2-like isoform X3 [Brassica napus]